VVDQKEYEFDAFVMYSSEDTEWVTQQLCPQLESENNLRLCLYFRDFTFGKEIIDNIAQSIDSSRKCLLIVSNAFSRSNWCQYEMSVAQTGMLCKDRNNVILVLLEEINEINMNPRLRHEMSRSTYAEWTGNVVGQQLFWKRLTEALIKPSLSVMYSEIPLGELTEQYHRLV